jgi:hypothetical protein
MGDAERFLEAFEHAFAVLVWVLADVNAEHSGNEGTHGLGVLALVLVFTTLLALAARVALGLLQRGLLPPQMTRSVHRRRLMRLLQQLGPVQRSLGDQRIVPVHFEHPRALQRPDDQRDRRELRPTLRDRVFVHRKGLHVEIVREVFEAGPALGRDLGGEEEETEGERGRVDLGREDGRAFAHEFEDRGHFGVPVVFLRGDGQRVARVERSCVCAYQMFAVLVPSTELDARGDECRECIAHAFASGFIVPTCGLQQL